MVYLNRTFDFLSDEKNIGLNLRDRQSLPTLRVFEINKVTVICMKHLNTLHMVSADKSMTRNFTSAEIGYKICVHTRSTTLIRNWHHRPRACNKLQIEL